MNFCTHNHVPVQFAGTECPFCKTIAEREDALDTVMLLEWTVADLEEKLRLLEENCS